jgi:hypothetical protein
MTEEQARAFAAWVHGRRAALIVSRDAIDPVRNREIWRALDMCQDQWKLVQEYLVEHKIGIPK